MGRAEKYRAKMAYSQEFIKKLVSFLYNMVELFPFLA